MGKKKAFFSSCKVQRTYVLTHGTINIETGEEKFTKRETITGDCNTPLFNDKERETGVCRSCSQGWEVPDNRFASPADKSKAKDKSH